MNCILNNIGRYWKAYIAFFAIGGWVVMVEMGVASGEKKDASQDQIMAGVVANQAAIIKTVAAINGKVDVVLSALGFKFADSTMFRWKKMAKRPPLDSLGKPIIGAEWLVISEDYLIGKKMKWGKHDAIFVRIEWDESRHRRDSI